MRARARSLLPILGVKAASICVPLYGVVYLATLGGLAELGQYSALTAILAPIAMFSVFRYTEFIASATERAPALVVALIASTGIFSSLGLFATVLLCVFGEPNHGVAWIWLIYGYKILEMVGDIVTAYLVSIGRQKRAALGLTVKLASVCLISLGLYFDGANGLTSLAAGLFLGYAIGFFLIDLRLLFTVNIRALGSAKAVFRYIKANAHFGFFGVLVSLNSVAPRYLVGFFSGLAALGLFTILYQVSATLVNIVQYVLSVKVIRVSRLVMDNIAATRILVCGFGLCSLTTIIFASPQDIDLNTAAGILQSVVLICGMALAMFLRGFVITARTLAVGFPFVRVQVGAMLAATLLVLSMHAAGAQVGWQPFIFVVSSSLVTALCASFFSV